MLVDDGLGHLASFVVMDFADPADNDLVYTDSMAGDLFLEREADVRRYATTFEHLQAMALDPAQSVQMIETAAGHLRGKGGSGT